MSFHGQLLPGPFPIVWLCEGLELVHRCDTLAGWYGRLPCSCGHLLRRCGVGRCVNLGVLGETRIGCVVRGHEYNPYVRMDLLEVRVYYVFTTTMYEGYA